MNVSPKPFLQALFCSHVGQSSSLEKKMARPYSLDYIYTLQLPLFGFWMRFVQWICCIFHICCMHLHAQQHNTTTTLKVKEFAFSVFYCHDQIEKFFIQTSSFKKAIIDLYFSFLTSFL